MIQAFELRRPDTSKVLTGTCNLGPGDHMPDVMVLVNPDGSQTIYHQMAQGRSYVYVESIVSIIGGSQ